MKDTISAATLDVLGGGWVAFQKKHRNEVLRGSLGMDGAHI